MGEELFTLKHFLQIQNLCQGTEGGVEAIYFLAPVTSECLQR